MTLFLVGVGCVYLMANGVLLSEIAAALRRIARSLEGLAATHAKEDR